MSPGAFWGRPGGGVNPFINPAVGAPVHGSPGGFFGMNMHPVSPGASMDEPSGYFPPLQEMGYFPPMTSNLANEILRDKSGDGDTPGSMSLDATDMRTRSVERQTSSSSGTSWHTSQHEAQAQATRDAGDKETSSSVVLDNVNDIMSDGLIRTNSTGVSASGRNVDCVPMSRCSSDPVHTGSRDQFVLGDDVHSSADDGEKLVKYAQGTMGGIFGLGLSIAGTDI